MSDFTATELRTQPPLGLELDSLAHIDTSTLSQSELHALSLCSASAFDLRRTDDVIDPVIDRSTFNESAGSRRQTYSATGHRRRIAGLLPAAKHPAAAVPSGDSEHVENKCILGFLKRFIAENPRFTEADLVPPPVPRPESRREVFVYQKPASFGGENKRKRGRKPKARTGAEEQGLEILNRNGVAVDLLALENSEDLYGDEFRRRTAGMESEEELLGFLNELDGQWGSRRKRRKFVDAGHFGDALPVGWKLLLGLKRREGRASIYCRRYISPGGKQFVTCREASLYLQSYHGRSYTHQPNKQRVDKIQRENTVVPQRFLGVTPKEEDHVNDIVISSSSLPCVPASNVREKEVNLMEIGKLADVQIHDLFECRKCNETFDERDTYLQHLLSSHQRTTRRYRLGSSVGDGVIVKDGKYECQFCHKVFQERRRYNGHVGIHVRNYVRKVEETPSRTSLQTRIESPNTDDTRQISKMDALIEIAQSSIRETTNIEEPNCNSIPGKINMVSAPEIPVADSAQEMKVDSPLSELDIEGRMIAESRGEESCQQDSESNLTNGKVQKPNKAINVVAKVDSGSTPPLHTNDQNCKRAETFDGKDGVVTTTDEINKSGIEQGRSSDSHLPSPLANKNPSGDQSKWISTSDHPISDLEFGFNNDGGPDNDVVGEPIQRTQENAIPFDVSDSLMPLVQPVHSFSANNLNLDKGQGDLSVELGHDNVTGFEELRLDEFEPLKFNFVSGQQSPSLQEIPMDLADNSEAGKVYEFTDQFAQLTTACVWCGVEFSHDAVDSEIQSDSVGFMCPTCKAKISGQLNILGAGASMNSHQL